MPLFGIWEVSFKAPKEVHGGRHTRAHIFHNQREVPESLYLTFPGWNSSSGDMMAILEARAGDTISLRTPDFANKFYSIHICFEYKQAGLLKQ